MSRLRESFRAVRAAQRGGFIPFLVAGDPDLTTTAKVLTALDRLGTCRDRSGRAVQRSDRGRTGHPTCRPACPSATAPRCRKSSKCCTVSRLTICAPIVLFSYYNPIFQFGLAAFARAAAESRRVRRARCRSPRGSSSSVAEETAAAKDRSDFSRALRPPRSAVEGDRATSHRLYLCVARTGVTGTARELADESANLVARIRTSNRLPVAVGFGITTGAQARHVCRYATQRRGLAPCRRNRTMQRPPNRFIARVSSDAVMQAAREFFIERLDRLGFRTPWCRTFCRCVARRRSRNRASPG